MYENFLKQLVPRDFIAGLLLIIILIAIIFGKTFPLSTEIIFAIVGLYFGKHLLRNPYEK